MSEKWWGISSEGCKSEKKLLNIEGFGLFRMGTLGRSQKSKEKKYRKNERLRWDDFCRLQKSEKMSVK